MNRERMEFYTKRVFDAGGVIHPTARGGPCVHPAPSEPGEASEPSSMADQDDADWLIALVRELWPQGVPGCTTGSKVDARA